METRLRRTCDRFIEAGWLLAVALIPTFFNVRTLGVFEPDKGALLQGLALGMIVIWMVKTTEQAVYWLLGQLGQREQTSPDGPRRSPLSRLLLVPILLFAAVTLASTLTSVQPRISLMGSYQRGQGTLLTLSLVAIALLVAAHLRTRSQLGRLLAAVALGSLPVVLYAVLQGLGADPLPWGSPKPVIASTLGNTDFLAAYLAVVIPFTVAGLLALVVAARNRWWRSDEDSGITPPATLIVGYGLPLLGGLGLLGLQVYALALTEASAAAVALLTAAVPSLLLLAASLVRRSQRRLALLGLATILIAGILFTLTFVSLADVSIAEWPLAQPAGDASSPVAVTRQLIWEGARDLLRTRPLPGGEPDRWAWLRPLLGYGPETMYTTYPQVYQPELGHYEARSATPDRAFNQLLDVGVNLGWAGIVAFLGLLLLFVGLAVTLVWKAQGPMEAVIAGSVLWAGLVHFVTAQFSVAIISTQLLFWIGLGAMATLTSLREEPVADPANWPLASGVSLLLLPTTALVTATLAGFVGILQDGVALFLAMLGGLILAVATATVNALAERRAHPWRSYPAATYLLAFLALGLFAIACLVVNGLLTNGLSAMALDLGNPNDVLRQTQMFLILPWGALLLGMGSIALSLPLRRASLGPKRLVVAPVVAASIGVLLVVGAVALIWSTSTRPRQADIVFKLGQGQQRMGSLETAVDLYEQAIELAPHQDFYYIFMGQAQLEQAKLEQKPTRQADWLAQAQKTFERAQVLNPLNPDHAANLARFHWQATALETDSAAKATNAQSASVYYKQATDLAPNQPLLWNEWAQQLQQTLGDEAQACRLLEHSLALDPAFERTKQFYAQTCPKALPIHPQNLDFEQSAP